jgi:hypothetical protein
LGEYPAYSLRPALDLGQAMKMWKSVGLLVLIMSTLPMTASCQLDSSKLEFFPHHKGDVWQYRHGNMFAPVGTLNTRTLVVEDTILPNGKRYFGIGAATHPEFTTFYRIDSLQRLQVFRKTDSTEWNVYRLGEKDSSIWTIKFPYLSDALLMYRAPYYFRFNGIFSTYAFGSNREIMEFQQGGTHYEEGGDTTIFLKGPRCYLMRGIGIYREETHDEVEAYSQLTGAIIGGINYGTVVASVSKAVGSLQFSLLPNYPNPFNPSTTFSFGIPTRSHVRLNVFDLLGREVASVVSEEMPAGTYTRQWNAAGLPSGVYFYRLQAGSFNETKRLLLLR